MAGPEQPVRCVRCGGPVTVGLEMICPRCGMPVSASVALAPAGSDPADAPPGVPPDFDQPTLAYPSATAAYGPAASASAPLFGSAGLPRLTLPPPADAAVPRDPPEEYGTPGAFSATLPGYRSPPRWPDAQTHGGPDPDQAPPDEHRVGTRMAVIAGLAVVVALVCGVSVVGLVGLAGKGATTARSIPRGAATTAAPAGTGTAGGKVIYGSSLKGSAVGWPDGSGCASRPDGYHVLADVSCFAPTDDLGDFDLQVTAQQVAGDSSNLHGVMFRGDVSSSSTSIDNVYAFFISDNGHWYFIKFLGGKPTVIQQGTSRAIHGTGANVIGVRAQGTHFTLTVNGTTLADVHDSSIAKGRCGLQGFAGSDFRFTDLAIRGV